MWPELVLGGCESALLLVFPDVSFSSCLLSALRSLISYASVVDFSFSFCSFLSYVSSSAASLYRSSRAKHKNRAHGSLSSIERAPKQKQGCKATAREQNRRRGSRRRGAGQAVYEAPPQEKKENALVLRIARL